MNDALVIMGVMRNASTELRQRSWLAFAVAVSATATLAAAPVPAAASATSIPYSAVLAASELPALSVAGSWNGPSGPVHIYWLDDCSPVPTKVIDSLRVSYHTSTTRSSGFATVTILRFATAAEASAARTQWATRTLDCSIPRNPDSEGDLYLQGVERVDAIDDVDIYGLRFGATYYVEAPESFYKERFVAQRGSTLYFVDVTDNQVATTHEPLGMTATVAAVKRRLAEFA